MSIAQLPVPLAQKLGRKGQHVGTAGTGLTGLLYPVLLDVLGWTKLHAALAALGLGLVCIAIYWLGAHMASKSRKSVEEELREIRETVTHTTRDMFNGVLLRLAKDLRLSNASDTRISLYIDLGAAGPNGGRELRLFGRFSFNSEYNTNGNRIRYSTEEGVIGKVWKDGSCYCLDSGPDPHMDPRGYQDWHGATGISPEITHGLRMRSRWYVAHRIDTPSRDALGVLVVESTSAEGCGSLEQRLRMKMRPDDQRGEATHLADLIMRTRPYLETRNMAEEHGFG